MTSPQAILTGAALIAMAVALSNGGSAVSADSSARYALVSGELAMQVDTVTGAVRHCSYRGCGEWKGI
jgi:hypothetical protein